MRRIPICILRAVILVGAVGLPSSAQEQSVKPGINQNFQNPNPAEFIKRFERAGRDIYDYREKIVEACGLQPGTDIADVGAGTGLFSRLFAQKVGPKGVVRAVDISDEFVAHITNTCAAAGITNVIASVCASDDIGLPPDSTDVAFVCDTYHHLEFPQKTLRSIHRALREHGRLVVIDFERVPGRSSQWILDHVRAGKELVRKEIESAGFHFAEEKGFLRENYLMVFEKSGP